MIKYIILDKGDGIVQNILNFYKQLKSLVQEIGRRFHLILQHAPPFKRVRMLKNLILKLILWGLLFKNFLKVLILKI